MNKNRGSLIAVAAGVALIVTNSIVMMSTTGSTSWAWLLLVQVAERRSGARIARIYRVAGRAVRPGPKLLDNISDPASAAAIAARMGRSTVFLMGGAPTVLAGTLSGVTSRWTPNP